MHVQISPELNGAEPPDWFPGTDEAWAAIVARIRRREDREQSARWQAIGKFYGIAIDGPPVGDDRWQLLARALAVAHVPGLACGELGSRAKAIGKRPVRLPRYSTLVFAMMVHIALQAGHSTPHTIARFVVEYLRKLAANNIKLLRVRRPKISQATYEKSRRESVRQLPFETVRYLVPELRCAWQAVCRGTATTFQYQVVSLAVNHRKYLPMPKRAWQDIFDLKAPR